METRAEREVFNKSYSLREFEKLSSHKIVNNTLKQHVLQHVEDKRPKRKLQPIKPFTDKDPSVRVMLTLQEYKDKGISSNDEVDGDSDTHQMTGMTEKKSKVKIDANAISGILTKTSEDLQQATQEYLEAIKKEERRREETPASLGLAIEALKNKKQVLSSKLKEIILEEGSFKEEKRSLESSTDSQESKFREILQGIKDSVPEEHQEILTKMKKLISMNEKLKKNEAEFRKSCKRDLETLQNRNEEALERLKQVKAKSGMSQENKELKEKLNSKKKELAEISRQCLELDRKIDRIPTRAELSQYQRRFVELYGQMDSTQSETQHFFDMYNNLGLQRSAIEREIQLMNSIQEGFITISLQKQQSKFEVCRRFIIFLFPNILLYSIFLVCYTIGDSAEGCQGNKDWC